MANRAGEESIYKYPFYFDDREFYALESLIEQFSKNFESWAMGENFFSNNEILIWVEKNEDEVIKEEILKIKEDFPHKNISFFHFIYRFNKSLPFILLGEKINLLLLEKIFIKRHDKLCLDEKVIHNLFFKGDLIGYSKAYDRIKKKRTIFTQYLIQIDNYYKQTGDKKSILGYLQYLNKTKLYIFPINSELITLYNLKDYLSIDEINELKKKFNLPRAFIPIIENFHPIPHKKIIHKLRHTDDYLLPTDFYQQISHSFVKTVMSMEKFLLNDEWIEIKENHYLPRELIEKIENSRLQSYLEIIKRLRFLQNNKILLEHKDYSFHKSLFGNYYNIKVGTFKRIEVDFDKISIDEYKKLHRFLTVSKYRRSFKEIDNISPHIKKSRTSMDYVKAFLSYEIIPKSKF